MGWNKRPTAFTQEIITAVSDKMRGDALCILGNLTAVSPVDTGRFKGNWQVSIGAPNTSQVDTQDKAGSLVMSIGEAVLRGHKGFTDIWISNNLPYARKLNNGHSGQAPANFVQDAVLKCGLK